MFASFQLLLVNRKLFSSQFDYFKLEILKFFLILPPSESYNLVLLFFELICHDVFSHDHYLRALISRGDINGPITNTKNQNSNGYDKYEEYIENIAERYQDDDSDDESGNDSDESNSDRSRKSKKKRDENDDRSNQDGDGSFDDNKIKF